MCTKINSHLKYFCGLVTLYTGLCLSIGHAISMKFGWNCRTNNCLDINITPFCTKNENLVKQSSLGRSPIQLSAYTVFQTVLVSILLQVRSAREKSTLVYIYTNNHNTDNPNAEEFKILKKATLCSCYLQYCNNLSTNVNEKCIKGL